MDSTNRAAFSFAVVSAIHVLLGTMKKDRKPPTPIHPGGPEYARELADTIYHGSETQFKDLFRMDRYTFDALVRWLQIHTGMEATRYQTVRQKVMVVLYILAHAEAQRTTAHKFQISQSTVSEIMKDLLPRLVTLHQHFVRLPDDDYLDPDIELDPTLNAFNGCIGAIDGTHVAAHVPLRQQLRYRDRKGNITQNVFAAVKFDYTFTYVLAGAEGSLNDASLSAHAFGRSFRVPESRYYVTDAGFGTRPGIVIPYSNVRYHLQDWRNADKPPETAKELYNLRHARIRVVVEQVFGLVKRRWKIVRVAPIEYSMKKQVQIVYAVTGLHNFIAAHSRKEARVLTQVEERIMRMARRRARESVRGVHSDNIRHNAAWLMNKQWQSTRRG